MSLPVYNIVAAMQLHAGNCKKPLAECVVCTRNIEAMREIPLPQLATCLEDRHVPPMRTPVYQLVADQVFSPNPKASLAAHQVLTLAGVRFSKDGHAYLPK